MSRPQFVDHLVFRVADLGKTERFSTTVLKQEPQRADDSAMYQVGETPYFSLAAVKSSRQSIRRKMSASILSPLE
jgi:hypothetical protein